MPSVHARDKGAEIECVYIPESDRGTLCVSSQVGCTLNCSFCHTGTMPLVRNLTAAEIVGQVLVARDRLGDFPGGVAPTDGLVPSGEGVRAVSNVVFMGMGEPLYNFEAVRDAIAVMTDGDGLSLSRRRITVSTSGVVPEMPRLGAECGTMLAVSLHATNNPLRDRLVPLNRKYPIEQLLKACRDYPGASNARRITFEYVMLKGVNDTPAEAKSLVRLLKGLPAKINLIPFNPWPGSPFECSDWETIERFSEIVFNAGYASPVRTPRGRDILAACGQLKSESEKLRARARMMLEESSGRWTRLTRAWGPRRSKRTRRRRSTSGRVARTSLGDIFRAPRLDRRGIAALIGLVLVAWLSTSLYRVQPDEKGVVLRFGRWVATTDPGLHVHLPYPIDTVLLPKVTQINQIQLGIGPTSSPADVQSSRGGQMLTGDENIVEADCTVFWKIRDPGQFLFKVDNPELAVRIAAEGALRDVISRTPIQAAMSDKRQQIADETHALLQKLLDDEQAGVEITQVQLQRVEPPLAVIDAFNDVQRARADQERARNEAEAYANDILPRARGDGERIRQEAEAYKVQVVNLAQGDAEAFLPILEEL